MSSVGRWLSVGGMWQDWPSGLWKGIVFKADWAVRQLVQGIEFGELVRKV
jgi:hypothetical protein